MSLNSEINEALLQLRDEGKLLHWRDFKYPSRDTSWPSVLEELSIQYAASGDEVPDEALGHYFTDVQIEFIHMFRKVDKGDEKDLENIFKYAESLSEIDLELEDFHNDEIRVSMSMHEVLGQLYNWDEDPFRDPQYLLLTAIAAHPDLELELARKICDLYVQDAYDEDSNDGWIAIGIISNPSFTSLHPKIIEFCALSHHGSYGPDFLFDLERPILFLDYIQNSDLDNADIFTELYSYDMGRVVENFNNFSSRYQRERMEDSKEADNPEFIPLYNAAADGSASGIALLDDGSDRLVYFGQIEESYKSSFKVDNYLDLIHKIVKPVLDKSNIDISRYSVEEINDLFHGTSQIVWDYLCGELDVNTLEGLTSFGDQNLIKTILANESLPKELRVLAALQSSHESKRDES
jgi:hypothetical protein